MKKIIQQYFTFNKREAREVLVLAFLIVAFLGFNWGISFVEFENIQVLNSKDSIEIQAFYDALEEEEAKPYLNRLDQFIVNLYDSIDLFDFDPNISSINTFMKLGLTEKQAKNISNYRDRGGQFFKKEDFRKIYSIRNKQYQILKPYIKIKSSKKFEKKTAEFKNEVELFEFNPNTISFDSLKLLGIRDYHAKRVISYREKVTSFKQKSDLLKVYGFDTLQYSNLEAFIQLPNEYIAPVIHYDLNSIEAKALMKVFEIEAKFAYRIVNYRNKLGGFYSKNQVFEVYEIESALVDALISKIDLAGNNYKKINLNMASDELIKHPYIWKKNISRIEQFKLQNKQFNSILEIEQSGVFLPKEWAKIKPYLTVD